MISLTKKKKKELQAVGKHVKPEIWIGKNGLTKGVLTTIENAFRTKELVKIKILSNSMVDKTEVSEMISDEVDAVLIQMIGNALLFYRPSPEEQ